MADSPYDSSPRGALGTVAMDVSGRLVRGSSGGDVWLEVLDSCDDGPPGPTLRFSIRPDGVEIARSDPKAVGVEVVGFIPWEYWWRLAVEVQRFMPSPWGTCT